VAFGAETGFFILFINLKGDSGGLMARRADKGNVTDWERAGDGDFFGWLAGRGATVFDIKIDTFDLNAVALRENLGDFSLFAFIFTGGDFD
jgi:hypothetical protein